MSGGESGDNGKGGAGDESCRRWVAPTKLRVAWWLWFVKGENLRVRRERVWEGLRYKGVSGWELQSKCKMFYQNFKRKIFYINLPSWFSWLKIFYFWLNILLQNKHSKMGKYFTLKQTECKMQSSTKNDVIIFHKKHKIIMFLKSISCCQKKKKKIQTKTYFCYFNIAFKTFGIVVFLVFGVINAKYLAFRTPDASTLLLGWLKFLIFFLNFLSLLNFWVG